MALEQLDQPIRLVTDFVLPDGRRIEKGVYDAWPEGVAVPKSAKPYTPVEVEQSMPAPVSELIPKPVKQKKPAKDEPQTLLDLGAQKPASAASKAKAG